MHFPLFQTAKDLSKDRHQKKLKDLLNENTTFWKISQSSPRKSYEDFFINYPENSIVSSSPDGHLCFVRAENIGNCLMYHIYGKED